MREILTHKVNGCNDQLRIKVRDEPGSGGAHHRYDIFGFNTDSNPSRIAEDAYSAAFSRLPIVFQNGPIKETGTTNGVTHEALLAIVADRLECFQAGKFACDENQLALGYVKAAMAVLKSRTENRLARGVEGTHQV